MRNKNAKVSDPNSFVSNPGSSERIVYSVKIDESGIICVVETGKENFQDYIESFRGQTDMAYILKELSLGNLQVLNQSSAQYGDFTQMPKSLYEAMQLQIDAEKQFYQLDLDVRNKFNNNYREWCFTAGSEEWNKKMGLVPAESNKEGETAQVAEE